MNIELTHPGLKDLLLLNQYSPDKKIGFVSLETHLPRWFKRLTEAIPIYAVGLQIRREYRHIAMGLRALRLRDVDTIFVLEVYNQHLIFLLPLLVLSGKEVWIGIHGNQQFAMYSRFKLLGLIYLKFFLKLFKNLKVVLFEIDDRVIPKKFRFPAKSKITVPHPIISEAKPSLRPGERLHAKAKIKIGVVGMIRPDKPIAKLVEKLQDYIQTSNSECELVIGTPFGQKPKYLDQMDAKLYDTTEESDYISVLKQIDILVIHYEKNRYYYRASGVISDAASCGCYIVASGYPVIEHQISWPVEIGSTFSNFDEIKPALDRAIAHVREKGQDNHWIWRKERSAEAIAKILCQPDTRKRGVAESQPLGAAK